MKQLAQDFQAVISAPFGTIGIVMQATKVSFIDYLAKDHPLLEPRNSTVAGLVRRIQAYLQDPQAPIEPELELKGTPFQQRVWNRLLQIPVGQTQTYGELAAMLGTSARAVGNACRANPCPLLVPCHRVVAKQGLGGFAGQRSGEKLEVKRWLLRHEGVL